MKAGVLLALLLAGCATDNSPQGLCARRAYDDPTVKELMAISAGTPGALMNNEYVLDRAKKAATTKCLQDMGIARPGGVEQEAPRS